MLITFILFDGGYIQFDSSLFYFAK